MTTHPLRIAVIGAGKIASDQHLPALAGDAAFAPVALVDPRDPGIDLPCFASLDDLLRDGPAIDAVAVCTPPQVREDVGHAALAAGLHVLLEKPPAASVGGIERLKAATPAGRTLFAAWHAREAPMVAAAREWLAGRRIASGRLRWREDVRHWHPGQHWLWRPGGLGVFDTGINGLSILTAISGQRFSVADAAFEVPANQHAPIAAHGSLRCDSGTLAFDLDFREPGPPIWEIAIETACGHRLLLTHGGGALTVDDAPPRSAEPAEYAALYRRFASLIAAGRSEVDVTPLALVADAFLIARGDRAEPFEP